MRPAFLEWVHSELHWACIQGSAQSDHRRLIPEMTSEQGVDDRNA